jgi:hypothetical protein
LAQPACAQVLTPPPTPIPPGNVSVPTPSFVASNLSAGAAVASLGSNFAGASASISLSNTARLYLNCDGKFRSAFQSHQGTMGVELRW